MRQYVNLAGLVALAWLFGTQISEAQQPLTPEQFAAEYIGEAQVRDEMVPLTPVSGLSSTLLSRTFGIATPFADDSNGLAFVAQPKWYWRHVDSEGKPIQETGFLEHATTFQLKLGYWTHEMNNGDDGDGPIYGVHIRYVGDRVPITLQFWYDHQGRQVNEFPFCVRATTNRSKTIQRWNAKVGSKVCIACPAGMNQSARLTHRRRRTQEELCYPRRIHSALHGRPME